MTPTLVQGNYTIPHHAVFKNVNGEPKIRVVFDASARSYGAHDQLSLNEALHAGPKLQQDLAKILIQFRLPQMAFTTDIVKMYRQILVHPDHRKYQHIFWRNSPNKSIVEYELNTITYGLKCAPFLVIRTLQQLVLDEGLAFPCAALALQTQTYVDDIVTGANSLAAALQLKSELTELLKLGGFSLKKWASNSNEFLHSLPSDEHESVYMINPDEDTKCKDFRFAVGYHSRRFYVFSRVIKRSSN